MALITEELDKKMLEYSISQYRVVPEYVKICEAFCVGLTTIQTAIDYLSDMIDVDKAEGIWLDYLAWLVGTSRSSYDITQYFCVNAPHLNVEKLFYFEGISTLESGSIDDIILRKKVKAKVAYNTSKATRNENIRIIEGMVNADKVIIEKAKIFDNFTIVGNPTISSDGVVSGFSDTSYIKTQSLPSLLGQANSWEIDLSFTTPSDVSNIVGVLFEGNSNWCQLLRIGKTGHPTIMQLSLTSTGNSYDIASYKDIVYVTADTTYWVKIIFTGTEYLCKYSTDNINFTTVNVATSSAKIKDNSTALNVGINKNANPAEAFKGTINLKEFKIIVDGKTVYKPYTEEPMLLDIKLQGVHLIYPSTQSLRNSIEGILGNGVGIRNLTIL